MKRYIYTILALVIGLAIAAGCKKEYKDAPYPWREITSFKVLYGANDTLKAAITGDSVVVYWSGFKKVPDSVTPIIKVSDNAHIFPASGQKVALRTGTTFTVTAQDSSKSTYKLIVKIYQDKPELTDAAYAYNVKTAWEIDGFQNLIPDTSLTQLFAIGKNGKETNIPLIAVSATVVNTKNIPAGLLDTGYYKLKLVNNVFTVYSKDSALHLFSRPEITALSILKGAPGDEVIITGEYFSATAAENIVKFSGIQATNVSVVSAAQLKAIVPEGANTGKITLTVGALTGTSVDVFNVLSAAATTVTTFAGSGANAITDGPAATAAFRTITGITRDGNGNFYVVENSNHLVRKITPAGEVGPFAGSGIRTYTEGTGTAASFNAPVGIIAAPNGNLYLADVTNNRIRQITSTAVVTTFAGSGIRGFADGTLTTAQFSFPREITMDANGNIYIAEITNQRIRKITPGGVVSTLAGDGTAGHADGPGATAQFSNPYGLAIDANGNVYVAEQGNHCIRKITPAGVVSTLAGNPGNPGFANGTGAAAQFNGPCGMAIDANGYLYVCDLSNHRIRQVSPDGKVITWAGSGEDGFANGSGSEAMFSNPRGITIDANGILYVTSQNRVRKIVPPTP